jgi:hypothetical protein
LDTIYLFRTIVGNLSLDLSKDFSTLWDILAAGRLNYTYKGLPGWFEVQFPLAE